MGRLIALCTLSVLLTFGIVLAEVPQTISYQGVLKDSDGTPVADGDHEITFRLYDAEAAGNLKWQETDTLTVSTGVFNAILGKETPLDLAFDTTYWLSVEVESGGELSPRVELTASPYAFRAAVAESALVVGAVPSHDHDGRYYTETELNTPGTVNDPSNPVDWTKLKSVPAGFADGVDDAGSAEPDSDWTISGDDLFSAVPGNVGIGLMSPTKKLDVLGSARIDGDLIVTGGLDPKWMTLIPQASVPTETEGRIYYDDSNDEILAWDGDKWLPMIGGFDILRADSNPWLTDSVTFVAGQNVSLSQSGDSIEISATGTDFDWDIIGTNMNSIPTGNVGIGVAAAATTAKLDVESAGNISAGEFTATGTGVGVDAWGVNNHGVYGLTGSASLIGNPMRAGLAGESQNQRGVAGYSENSDGVHGLSGVNPLVVAPRAGVVGESTDQHGVAGASDNSDGVHGISGADPGGNPMRAGVAGESVNERGVAGYSETSNGVHGLSGVDPPGDPRTAGVAGESQDERGVSGYSQSNDGVQGSMSTTGTFAIGPASIIAGVHGESAPADDPDNFAVAGTAGGYGTGVLGIGASKGHGVLGVPGKHVGVTTAGVRGITREGQDGGEAWPPHYPIEELPDKKMVGVLGQAHSMVGVWGESIEKIGVVGNTGERVPFAQLPDEPAGVYGTASQDIGFGVLGLATSASSGESFGVGGQSISTSPEAAGVLGKGNGVNAPGDPRAAAVAIHDGAITVSGDNRPAGTMPASGTWQNIESCAALTTHEPPTIHCHTIGAFIDVDLQNSLIVPNSIILLTVEGTPPPPPGMSCYAQVLEKSAGTAMIRVTVMGGDCFELLCQYGGGVDVHYLIINPL